MAAQVTSAQTLPAPGTVISGVPISQQFDDAYSYPTRLLDYFFPTAGWDTSAGTGTLDVIVTTRSSGQTNSGGALAPFNIPDPITNPNTNPINDTWGAGPTADSQMLVSDLLSYLQTAFDTTVPTFTFDQNETGGNPALSVAAKVEIVDPLAGVLHTWAFDASTQPGDGAYNPDAPVLAPGEIVIPDVLNTCPGDTCTFNNNVGSGQFDYIILVPTMDLAPWADADNLFKMTWTFLDVDDGGEEITITGRFFSNQVPEPAPLALLAFGLVALFGVRRAVRA